MSDKRTAGSTVSNGTSGAGTKRPMRLKVAAVLMLLVAGAAAAISQTAPAKRQVGPKATDNPMIVPPVAQTDGTDLKAQEVALEQYSGGGTTIEKGAETTPVRKGGPAGISHMIEGSELIVRGLTKSVTDGIEKGIPFTQVTIQVKEAFRGEFGSEYTFRQYGLLAPKKVDGKIFMAATPEGWAKFAVGEDVLLFLYPRASVTGLRTTAGLGQGKIEIKSGNARSQLNNDRLFDGLEVETDLNESDTRLIATDAGSVNSEALISFVRRAVNEKWVERRVMRNAKK